MYIYRFYRQYGVLAFVSVLFICLPEIGLTNTFSDKSPPFLVAMIHSKNSVPKKFIRVEISGPEHKKMATNHEGMLGVTLKPGNYVIVIRERGRQMEFKLTVEKNRVTRKTFVLAW